MKNPIYILVLLLSSLPYLSFSQREFNIWYFGHNAGLDFNSNPPIPLTGSMVAENGCASVCNAFGELLFYSNGLTIWDRRHLPMPNTVFLAGGIHSSQAALIVPVPRSKTLYYVFTAEDHTYNNVGAISYSLVDIELNDGFGDVMTGAKDIMLLDSASEKLSSVLHSNGRDVWVITHRLWSNRFYAYLITENGLSATPVISEAGTFHEDGAWGKGQIRSSHSGNKLICTVPGAGVFQLFDFNTSSGEISNAFDLQSLIGSKDVYGVEFSPNDSLLYVGCYNTLLQLNYLEVPPGINIISNQNDITDCQLATDGKIYVAHFGDGFVGVVNQPDNIGVNCQYEDAGVELSDPTTSLNGLPNVITIGLCPIVVIGADKELCLHDSIILKPSLYDSDCIQGLTWYDGTADSSKVIHDSGVYWIEVSTAESTYRDSVKIQFTSTKRVDLELTICPGTTFESYSSSGTYLDTFISQSGCDSVRTLFLKILPYDTTVVDTFLFLGQSLYGHSHPGVYFDTLESKYKLGCKYIRKVILREVDPKAIIHYSLNDCESYMSNGSHMDYSEFTPLYPNILSCADISAGILHRVFPQKHSCTQGVGNTVGMCVTASSACEFVPGDSATVIIEFTMDPHPGDTLFLTHLAFYEKAPAQYSWIDGPSGPNNYPKLFGIRLLKNDFQVYLDDDVPTKLNWTAAGFDITIQPVLVDTFAKFRLELLGYCPVGNGAAVSVWDLEEIRIYAGCLPKSPEGLVIEGHVTNKSNSGIRNVVVELSQESNFKYIVTQTTDEHGFYSFNELPLNADYFVRCHKEENVLNGVSVQDLLQIQKHLLGISQFTSADQCNASDISNNGQITVTDLLHLQKALLGMISSFPNNHSWRFTPRPFDLNTSHWNQFNEVHFIPSFTHAVHDLDFMGIKIGDVTGDASPD